MDYVEAASMFLVIIGVHLIAIPRLLGQYIMFLAQVGWLMFALSNDKVFLTIQSAYLMVLAIVAIYSWKNKGIK